MLSLNGYAQTKTEKEMKPEIKKMEELSVPDTVLAYKYKESGKKKSANGDQYVAIDDYTKAIEIIRKYVFRRTWI